MIVHVPRQMTFLAKIQPTYLANVHPCCSRPNRVTSHDYMKFPTLPTLYIYKQGRAHFKSGGVRMVDEFTMLGKGKGSAWLWQHAVFSKWHGTHELLACYS